MKEIENKVIALKAQNITKYFYEPQKFRVLDNINFEVNKGEFLSLVGKSGCGKSTLLYILSTMDTDYEGTLDIDSIPITGMTQNQLAHIRNEKIGFVFQFHFLLPEFSCLDNVMMPALKLGKYSREEIKERAYQKLKILDMQDQALKPASKLSGGQQQRVAIARSLINDPLLIMGDEPTGNLDTKNTQIVFDIFKQLTVEYNQTIVAVTHDKEFAQNSDRIIVMQDGQIIDKEFFND